MKRWKVLDRPGVLQVQEGLPCREDQGGLRVPLDRQLPLPLPLPLGLLVPPAQRHPWDRLAQRRPWDQQDQQDQHCPSAQPVRRRLLDQRDPLAPYPPWDQWDPSRLSALQDQRGQYHPPGLQDRPLPWVQPDLSGPQFPLVRPPLQGLEGPCHLLGQASLAQLRPQLVAAAPKRHRAV